MSSSKPSPPEVVAAGAQDSSAVKPPSPAAAVTIVSLELQEELKTSDVPVGVFQSAMLMGDRRDESWMMW